MAQGDPHRGLGLSTSGSWKKTQAQLVPCSTSQDTFCLSRGIIWLFMEERENGSGPVNRGLSEETREEGKQAEMVRELNS